MNRFFAYWLCLISLPAAVPAQEEALEFLKAEIQRTAKQRDDAQKKLLETQTLSAEKVKVLSQEQRELQQRLNQIAREMLELRAGERMSKAAMERVERELQERENLIQNLRNQQQVSRQEFEEATRQLSERLAEAQMQAQESAGPEAAKLAEERETLRQQINLQEKQLMDLEAARQRDLNELSELRTLNQQLSQDLNLSRRGEALANAKLAALESRLGSLQQELATQYQERSKLEQEQERLQGIIQDLQTRLSDAENNRVPREQWEELSNTLQQAREENQALRNELSRREEVPDLRRDYEKLRKQNDLFQAKELTLRGKVEELETKLEGAQSENRQLQRQLREAQKVREQMTREISSFESILQEAKAAGIQEDDLEEVALLVAEMEREKEALRKEALQHRNNVDLLQAELDNQNSAQRKQIKDLQVMLGQQLEEITSARKKISELEVRSATLDEVRQQKAQLVKLQDKSRQDMRTLARHIYTLREELVSNKETQRKAILAIQKNQELADELGTLRAEMERIRKMNLSIQDHEAGKEEQLRKIRQELEIGRARSQALEQEKIALQLELQNLRRALMETAP
ncbi:MAG: hypothetical protein ACO3N7_00190 [Kiritimatiellia bacterium]